MLELVGTPEDRFSRVEAHMSFVPFLHSEGFISSKEIITFIKIGNYLKCYQNSVIKYNMSQVNRKTNFCICENKDIDQLYNNHYTDSRISLLLTSEISSF